MMRFFILFISSMLAVPAAAQGNSGMLYFCAAVDEAAGVYYHTDTFSKDVEASQQDYDGAFVAFLKESGLDGRGNCTFVRDGSNVPEYLRHLTNDGAYGLRRVDWKYPAEKAASVSSSRLDNLLKGVPACDMMDETSYREVGLSGGNDVQLKTMCAQAYEYFAMYEQALEQGYSLTDAKRTWDAHAAAAKNAISFYENNRAE